MSELPPIDVVAPLMRDLVRQFPLGGWQHERAIRAAITAGWQARRRHFNEAEESMMSGPHGTVHPPSILISWNDAAGGWCATAIMAAEPIALKGDSSSYGRHPGDALQALLERRFCALVDGDYAATFVEIAQVKPVEEGAPIAANGS